MSVTSKKRRSSRKKTMQKAQSKSRCDFKSILLYGGIGVLLFLTATALVAAYMLKHEADPAKLRIAVYILYGATALICGVLCTARKRVPVFPNCFFAGFAELLAVLFCALIAAKAQFSVFVCIPIALSLVCPMLGGILGKKI